MMNDPLNVLELFAGTKSIGKAAHALGDNVFSSDYDAQFETDYTVDILQFDTKKVPFQPNVIWASPPCTTFSVASIGRHWHRDLTPKTASAAHGMAMAMKTIEIINHFKPKYWFIENPRGMLRKMLFMQGFKRHTVTYCQYGDFRMKPTDIWTNHPTWTPRPPCKNGDTCHTPAPRGSRTGTQGMGNKIIKAVIPHELCMEIMRACHE